MQPGVPREEWESSEGGSWGSGVVVEWLTDPSSDSWEDSLWEDWGLGRGALGFPVSTVVGEGEDSVEEPEERLWACPR